jgi:hypothetical protein
VAYAVSGEASISGDQRLHQVLTQESSAEGVDTERKVLS